LGDLPEDEWLGLIKGAKNKGRELFDWERFTEVQLPIRIKKEWILLICSIKCK